MNSYKKLHFYLKTNIILPTKIVTENQKNMFMKTIKKLSAKSRLLLKKRAAYLCDIDYLTLTSEWYIKDSLNYIQKSLTTIVTNIHFGIQ